LSKEESKLFEHVSSVPSKLGPGAREKKGRNLTSSNQTQISFFSPLLSPSVLAQQKIPTFLNPDSSWDSRCLGLVPRITATQSKYTLKRMDSNEFGGLWLKP
jgi:hypothetical protein